MKYLSFFFFLIICIQLNAVLDWKYRKEYKILTYNQLLEKSIALTQNTNRLYKENKKLVKTITQPFRVIKIVFIFVVIIVICLLIGLVVLKIFLKSLL